MFPFFKGTVFENGIDAAFRSTKGKKIYLFKGDKYARIDFGTNRLVQSIYQEHYRWVYLFPWHNL